MIHHYWDPLLPKIEPIPSWSSSAFCHFAYLLGNSILTTRTTLYLISCESFLFFPLLLHRGNFPCSLQYYLENFFRAGVSLLIILHSFWLFWSFFPCLVRPAYLILNLIGHFLFCV